MKLKQGAERTLKGGRFNQNQRLPGSYKEGTLWKMVSLHGKHKSK